MKISTSYYLKFWLRNNIDAFLTIALIDFLFFRFFALSPFAIFISSVALFFYQKVILSHFIGKNRAIFELKYLEYIYRKKVKELYINNYGNFSYFLFFLDQLSQITYSGNDKFKKMLNLDKYKDDLEKKLAIFLKAAQLAEKNENYKEELQLLNKAFGIKPENILLNYRLAISSEKAGLLEDTLKYYNSFISGPISELSNLSEEIKFHCKIQISRITHKGLKKRGPNLGVRYMSY